MAERSDGRTRTTSSPYHKSIGKLDDGDALLNIGKTWEARLEDAEENGKFALTDKLSITYQGCAAIGEMALFSVGIGRQNNYDESVRLLTVNLCLSVYKDDVHKAKVLTEALDRLTQRVEDEANRKS